MISKAVKEGRANVEKFYLEECKKPMKQPKTPLEEILFVVESTNDIVSDIAITLNILRAEIKELERK